MDLASLLRPYRDYKQIHCDLVTAVKNTMLVNGNTLYRGDCIYETFLSVGNILNFYNQISSWTDDLSIAEGFSNIESIPEWYFIKDEWYSDDEYPFNNLSIDTLKPVVFKMESKNLNGLKVSDYLDIENETQYVSGDEKEYVLGNNTFKILSIEKGASYLLVTIESISEHK